MAHQKNQTWLFSKSNVLLETQSKENIPSVIHDFQILERICFALNLTGQDPRTVCLFAVKNHQVQCEAF